jgi:hypothetical protein
MKNEMNHEIILRDGDGTEKICKCGVLIESEGNHACVSSVGTTFWDMIRFTGVMVKMVYEEKLLEMFVKTMNDDIKQAVKKALEE